LEKTPKAEYSMKDLDATLRKISIATSVVAISLMIYGFADAVIDEPVLSFPGGSVLPLSDFFSFPLVPLSITAMSAGILMLCALPGIRVSLALGLYIRSRDVVDAAVALIVLFELFLSFHFSVR
jgi:hypothetical protein